MLAINQDPKVMEYFPELQDLETTKKFFVDTDAFQAQEFYKKYGFKIIGCAPEYLLAHLCLAMFSSSYDPSTGDRKMFLNKIIGDRKP